MNGSIGLSPFQARPATARYCSRCRGVRACYSDVFGPNTFTFCVCGKRLGFEFGKNEKAIAVEQEAADKIARVPKQALIRWAHRES